MQKWRLHNFRVNQSRQQILLLLLFCAFALVQLSSIEHKKQHLNGTDESVCVLCINTPDHALPSPSLSLFLNDESHYFYFIGLTESINSSAPIFYSPRAPPLSC